MIRFLVLAAFAATSTFAFATTPARQYPGSVPLLLGIESVRGELKLTSLQRAVLDSLRSEYKDEARKLTASMPQTKDQRTAAELQLAKLDDRYNARALSSLSSSQRARLEQIQYHVLGGTMLVSTKVQKKLGLNATQVTSIEKLRMKGLLYVARVNHQFEDGKISHPERIKLLRERRKTMSAGMLKLLTPPQRDAFSALGGQKFSI